MTTKTKNFQFKSFSIWGGNSGMPVSTDGVLLGAWANVNQSNRLVDIGTGTGLLALMCAQRNTELNIVAVDIDDHAIEAAKTNFAASPWESRFQLFHSDIVSFSKSNTAAFDTIICNPPYFNSGEQSSSATRATARHTDTLSHPALLDSCKELLLSDGSASFILPKEEAKQCIQRATDNGWHLSRLCKVKTTQKKDHTRYLFELQLNADQSDPTEETELIIHKDDGYSAEFVALTQSFYLKM
ncbi:tRNA1(Val) (adenine(37)-N6)-methyltransferase [Vibrio comitans]|uniref:tRNA1(Val) (adenine(37)-N6)-methyltransferase n=1 Tax=Vibrio comitans NBRC 102076 TaxID=1219078 RepID=A0A4Y3IL81_9VIBR|nr:methyltransferase [Vibrio comitans]GEA60283.1 tRNA1(Val) (adenine(37)-N6)-methyltransferase [Vibrio comitans NBRC 102076]